MPTRRPVPNIANTPAEQAAASRRAINCSRSRAPPRRGRRMKAGWSSGCRTTHRSRGARPSAGISEPMAARTLKPSDLARGIKTGDRATLARAITLIESKRADHRKAAHHLVQELLPLTGQAVRLGITGAPGAGKSTTIDVLGTTLTGAGHKVCLLAVDPSSSRTGGSILGDKTRMAQLASDPNAFVRPSPASGTLGGVAAKTRETMLLCEAAERAGGGRRPHEGIRVA